MLFVPLVLGLLVCASVREMSRFEGILLANGVHATRLVTYVLVPGGHLVLAVEPETESVPAPVADAPDTTTTKQQVEDPTKPDASGDEPSEGTSGVRRHLPIELHSSRFGL